MKSDDRGQSYNTNMEESFPTAADMPLLIEKNRKNNQE